MSTNYFVTKSACDDACVHCDQSEPIHLGKTFGTREGLGVIIRAYPEGLRGSGPLLSWNAIKGFIEYEGLAVTSENGFTYSTAAFIDMIENDSTLASRRSQYDEMVKGLAEGRYFRRTEEDYLDLDGYTCMPGEFS